MITYRPAVYSVHTIGNVYAYGAICGCGWRLYLAGPWQRAYSAALLHARTYRHAGQQP